MEESQIRRAGQWNRDALTNCYLAQLPRKFLRAMAGFKPRGLGDYYLPRAQVQPPESLVQALWPWIDQWLAWLDPEPADLPEHLVGEGSPDQDDMAAQGFLRLLAQLRIVILQDSVLLRREFPAHPMWAHELFHRADYLSCGTNGRSGSRASRPSSGLRS